MFKNRRRPWAILAVAVLFGQSAGAVTIPKQLTQDDRVEVVKILGLTTATKLLTNPFPLGGYSGFEVGLGLELIDVSDLGRLGATVNDADKELRYPRLTIGKGLYHNVDLFLHFAPQNSQSELTSFGGAVRYSFYEAKYLPVNLSVALSANHVNINDEFENRTIGADLIAGVYVNNFSLYMGVGRQRAVASFIGGANDDGTVDPADPDLNATTNTVTEKVSATRTLLGATLHIDDVYAAAQIDRYPDMVYSVKVGLRF